MRNLKQFISGGKKHKVVFASPDKERTKKARNMYDNKKVKMQKDKKTGNWLIGIR